MIKKLFLFFLLLICSPALAESSSGVGKVTQNRTITVPRTLLSDVIVEDAELVKYLDNMMAKYDSHIKMYGVSEFSAKNILEICAVADILKTNDDCVRRVLQPLKEKLRKIELKDVCSANNKIIGGTPHCISDVFKKSISGPTANPYHQDVCVSLYPAIGFAIEYAKKKGHDVVCGGEPVNGNILCTAPEKNNYQFYTFKFDCIDNTTDSSIENNLIRGICALSDAAYDDEISLPACVMNCAPDTENRLLISRFGLSVRPDFENSSDKCFMYVPVSDKTDIKLYPGYEYMSYVFQNIQTVLSADLPKIIKQYVRFQGIDVQSFSCEYSVRGYRPETLSRTETALNPMGHPLRTTTPIQHNAVMSSEYERAQNFLPDDDILRCQINGNEVDFIFDDLYESKSYEQRRGATALQCVGVGGRYGADQTCRGLTQEQCLSDIVQKAIPGGTRWDSKAEVCLMNRIENIRTTETYAMAAAGLVMSIFFIPAGAPLVGLAMLGTDIAFEAAFQGLDRYQRLTPATRAHDFAKAIDECRQNEEITCTDTQNWCLYNAALEQFARFNEIVSDLNDDQLSVIDEYMGYLDKCLTPEQIQNALSNSELKDTDIFMNKASIGLLVAGFLIQPDSAVVRLSKAPKTTKLLGKYKRVKSVVADNHTKIFVDDLTDTEQERIRQAFKSKGIYVSDGLELTADGHRYIGLAPKPTSRFTSQSVSHSAQRFDEYGQSFLTRFNYNIDAPTNNWEDVLKKWDLPPEATDDMIKTRYDGMMEDLDMYNDYGKGIWATDESSLRASVLNDYSIIKNTKPGFGRTVAPATTRAENVVDGAKTVTKSDAISNDLNTVKQNVDLPTPKQDVPQVVSANRNIDEVANNIADVERKWNLDTKGKDYNQIKAMYKEEMESIRKRLSDQGNDELYNAFLAEERIIDSKIAEYDEAINQLKNGYQYNIDLDFPVNGDYDLLIQKWGIEQYYNQIDTFFQKRQLIQEQMSNLDYWFSAVGNLGLKGFEKLEESYRVERHLAENLMEQLEMAMW